MSTENTDPETIAALIRAVGLPTDAADLARLLPSVLAFHRNAARLRDLDLRGVDPAITYRAGGA